MTGTRQDVLRHAPGTEPTVADGMERKTTRAQPNAGDVLSIDETQGLVTAIVSVTGIEDSVKDVIHPGSYKATLANRRPKVVQHHDWKQAVARVEDVRELPPGHPELPDNTGDGKPWPSAAGALVTTMRYNLKTAAGRDAFETVKFYSETHECEWSIGYRVPSGKSTRAKDGVRQIKAIDLYEISFVLFGAAPGTGTLAVKTSEPDTETGEEATAAADEAPVPPPSTAPDGTGVSSPDDVPAKEVDADGGGREDGSPGDPDAEPAPNPGHVDWDALDRAADRLTETAPDDGDGEEEDEDEGGETEEPAAAPAPETPTEDAEVDEKALTAQPVYDADIKRAFSPQKRREHAKRGTALPGGSFPIVNIADLKNAIKAYGRAKPEDREKVKRHIIARARALNATNLLPDGWNTAKPPGKPFGKKDDTGDDVDEAALTDAYDSANETKIAHISLDRSPRKNWVENTGQLPAYIQHIAKDLHTKRGMPLERAIPTAIAAVKRWAAGGGNVNADTRAKATKALAEWEALKAKNAARNAAKNADAYDPTLETGPYAGTREADEVVESVAYPHLPGTYEEIRGRLAKALGGGVTPGRNGAPLLTVDATWHDRTIVTWFPLGDAKAATSYEVPYRVDSSGQVWLGEPTEVKLTATTGDDAPLPQAPVIEALTDELRAGLLHEVKAGRVLSTSNANHLRGAVEQLIAVLEAAGIKIAARDSTLEDAERNAEPVIVPDSTAPSAQPDEMVKVDPLLRARALQVFAATNGD